MFQNITNVSMKVSRITYWWNISNEIIVSSKLIGALNVMQKANQNARNVD